MDILKQSATLGVVAPAGAAVYLGVAGVGRTPAAFGALLLLAAFWGWVRLRMADVSISEYAPRPARGAAASVAVIGVVGLMVTFGTGTVAAGAYGFQDCGVTDSAIGAFINGFSSPNEEGTCRFNPEDAGDYENVTQTDVYASALAMNDSQTSYMATRNNMAQDIRGVMWMKAKVEIIEGLNNGSTASEAKSRANSTIDNYTSMVIANGLDERDSRAQQLAYMANQTGADKNTTRSSKVLTSTGEGLYASTGWATVELPNGTNYTYDAPVSGTDTDSWIVISHSEISTVDYGWDHGTVTSMGRDSKVNNSDDTASTVTFTPTERRDINDDYVNASQQVKDNINAYVDDVYTEYEQGDINTTDLWDPVTLASEAATSYNSTGYYAYSNAEIAALGVTGDTNVSHKIETTRTVTEYNNSTGTRETHTETVNITGTLFIANSGDSVSLETGQTHDPANITGTVYMTVSQMTNTTTGNATNYSDAYFEVTNPFTIHEATNTKTGEEVNTTTAETKDYTSTNASALEEQLQELKDLRAYYENQDPGGGGGWFDGVGSKAGIAVALLGGGYLLAARDAQKAG